MLPLSCYFEEKYLSMEISKLEFVGHSSMVPDVGTYLPVSQLSKILVHTDSGYHLVSNVCQHRQSLIKTCGGHGKSLVCPVHGWSYDLEGVLKFAPKFPTIPKCNLPLQSLNCVNGFLFTGTAYPKLISDVSYKYVGTETMVQRFNWKIALEVYAENYHIDAAHPGLRSYVSASSIAWEFAPNYQVCSAAVKDIEKCTASYKKLRKYPSKTSVVTWWIIYPNIMIETYPGACTITVAEPIDALSCSITVYYLVEFDDTEFVQHFKEAYKETASEDDEICSSIQAGRAILHRSNQVQENPVYQRPLEDGLIAWWQYMRSCVYAI